MVAEPGGQTRGGRYAGTDCLTEICCGRHRHGRSWRNLVVRRQGLSRLRLARLQARGVVIDREGAEDKVDWKRLDDRTKAGFAEIEVARETVVENGVVCTLMPDDIHGVRKESATPSVSLHVYGRNLAVTGRAEYDPINKRVYPCPERKRK